MNDKIFKSLPGFIIIGNYLDAKLSKEVSDFSNRLQFRNGKAVKGEILLSEISQHERGGQQADPTRKRECRRELKAIAAEVMEETPALNKIRIALIARLTTAARQENERLIKAYEQARCEIIKKLEALTFPVEIAEQIADSAKVVRDAAGPDGSEFLSIGAIGMYEKVSPGVAPISLTYLRLFSFDQHAWRGVVNACEEELMRQEDKD